METEEDPINDIARKYFSINYVFPFQRLVINNILRAAGVPGFEVEQESEDELSPEQIVLLPTGAGKSLCFMIPAFLLEGITLVVFPLLSLISDQLRRTEEAQLPAAILRGGQSKAEREEIFCRCRTGKLKMILTNPETLLNPDVLENMKNLTTSHLVLDETHTVSEWGDSFRPAYLELDKIISLLDFKLVTAFTATASPHILKRVKEIIFPSKTPNIVYGNPDRDNISYFVIHTKSPSMTLTELTETSEKPLIIFSSSRTGTELTARMLRKHHKSNKIFYYHAGLGKEEKNDIENWFYNSDDGILVATCAYGMGIDKKNVRTVIHLDLPPSVESYLQESGRAGRDKNHSKAFLLFNPINRMKLESMTESLSKTRFKSMVSYAENVNDCRRETLLALLDSTPEICHGCDVCNNDISIERDSLYILNILKKNKRRFTKIDFIYFLKGFLNREIISKQLNHIDGFGILSSRDTEIIREIIDNLVILKEIKIKAGGFWKNYLS